MSDADLYSDEGDVKAHKQSMYAKTKDRAGDAAHSNGVAFLTGAAMGALQGSFYGTIGWALIYGMGLIAAASGPGAAALLIGGGAALFSAIGGIKAARRNAISPEHLRRKEHNERVAEEEQEYARQKALEHAPVSAVQEDLNRMEELPFAEREAIRRENQFGFEGRRRR